MREKSTSCYYDVKMEMQANDRTRLKFDMDIATVVALQVEAPFNGAKD